MTNQIHQPVLLESTLEYLAPRRGMSYLDLTAGYGGHAAAVLAQTQEQDKMVLVDRDLEAVSALKQQFPTAIVVHNNYATAAQDLVQAKHSFDCVLMDLGVSSAQLDNPHRGFSFNSNGPLDMRMDATQELSAADIVNHYQEKDLADLIYQYGDERRSRAIARAIVAARPLQTTEELAQVILSQFRKYQRIHPATRTFQALRIAVNDEIKQLESVLPLLPKLLESNGRLVIISFHSLEDRQVKHFFRDSSDLERLTKKAILGAQVDSSNRRARSAKLRAALKK